MIGLNLKRLFLARFFPKWQNGEVDGLRPNPNPYHNPNPNQKIIFILLMKPNKVPF